MRKVAPEISIGRGSNYSRTRSPPLFVVSNGGSRSPGGNEGRMQSPNNVRPRLSSPSGPRKGPFSPGNLSPHSLGFRRHGSSPQQTSTSSPPPSTAAKRLSRFAPTPSPTGRSSAMGGARSSIQSAGRTASAFHKYDTARTQENAGRRPPSSPNHSSRNRRPQQHVGQRNRDELGLQRPIFGTGTRFAAKQAGSHRSMFQRLGGGVGSRGSTSRRVRPITAPAIGNADSPEALGRGQGLQSSIGLFRRETSGGNGANASGSVAQKGNSHNNCCEPELQRAALMAAANENAASIQQMIAKPRPTSLPPKTLCNSNFLDGYSILRVIGKGSFGKVLLVRDSNKGDLCALKALVKARCREARHVRRARTERAILALVNHPFICKLRHVFQDDNVLFFVLDYCPGGELFFHLSRLRSFSEPMTRFYSAEVALAIEYMHKHQIIYRDLKPENILLAEDGHVRLVDFGLARMGISSPDRGANSFCGTYEYLAPEILLRSGHGLAVDWWNLGMVIFEMLTGLPPWYSKDQKKLFERICHAQLAIPSTMSEQAAELISSLLIKDPKLRAGSRSGLSELRRFNFFGEKFDWTALYSKKMEPPMMPCKKKSIESAANFESQFTNLPIAGADVFTVENSKSRTSNDPNVVPAGLGYWEGWDSDVLKENRDAHNNGGEVREEEQAPS